MKKLSILISFLLTSVWIVNAQTPTIQWQRSLGGTAHDWALIYNSVTNSLRQTVDGGYIMSGWSMSNDGDVTGHHGSTAVQDIWVVKTDSNGYIDWQRSLGGTDRDWSLGLEITADGGYIICGVTNSTNGDVTNNHGDFDAWIIKLDDSGNIQWQKCYGGTAGDFATAIKQTTDGGYIFTGYTNSNDIDVSGNHGNSDVWLVKIDSIGTLQWQKCLGGTEGDNAVSIEITTDGGFIIAASSQSIDGDLTINNGANDYWLIKTDNAGNIQWQKSLGGSWYDNCQQAIQTTDGGYLVTGGSSSNVSGDVTVHYGLNDFWLVKLDSTGIKQWVKTLGGSGNDNGNSVYQTPDGGYIVGGWSNSTNYDVTGNHGLNDYWIVKINSTGVKEWQKSFGGTEQDLGYCIQPTTDNGIIMTGFSYSNDGDVSGHHGPITTGDFWLVKTNPLITGIEENYTVLTNFNLFPNPVSTTANISYYLDEAKNVAIKIYDITGREISTLIDEKQNASTHKIEWSVSDQSKIQVVNGIYVIRLIHGNHSVSRKMTVIK